MIVPYHIALSFITYHNQCFIVLTTRMKLKSSAHYLGAMAIKINFWPASELFPTQTTLSDQVSYRSPYYTIQDQFVGSTGTDRTRGPFWRPRYPRYTKVARCALLVLPNHHQYSAYIGPIPGLDSVQTSRSERLILPARCGVCVQYDKRAVNDRSLIDTGRGTMVKHHHKTLPSLSFFSHTWLLPMIASNS